MTRTVSAATRVTTIVSSSHSKPPRTRSRFTRITPRLFRLFPERKRFVDQFLAARHFLRKILVDRRARLDERVLVRLVDLHATILELLEQAFVEARGDPVYLRLHLDGRVGEGL